MNDSAWPPYEDGPVDDTLAKERLKQILAAEIEIEKNRRVDAAKPPSTETEDHVTKKLIEQMLATSAASIDRARKGAEFVQTAASAIGVLYTGVLTLMFSVAENPLPVRGLIPTIFLAAAVVFATFYLSFLTDASTIDEPNVVGTPTQRALIMANFLTRWTRNVTRNRVGMLRAAVMSMAVGVALLPIGLISIPGPDLGGAAAAQPEIPWPTPEALAEPELAAVLYDHQLDQFASTLGGAPPDPPLEFGLLGGAKIAWHDAIAAIAAIIGVGLVVLSAVWPRGRSRRNAGT